MKRRPVHLAAVAQLDDPDCGIGYRAMCMETREPCPASAYLSAFSEGELQEAKCILWALGQVSRPELSDEKDSVCFNAEHVLP